MAIQKRPYELSVWIEKLNGSNSKIEEKGVIIGAHDMSYPGKATNIVLKRELKGTNTLTFQMPDKYFDSLVGDYVRNEFIDAIYPECKLKLFFDDQWFEFFVKKVDEKKQFKSYMKSFTCTDAFIDELSRNGYGITFDTELYNNVEETGTFMEVVLEDSIWQYHPEHNWGDFSEFKEEKLYKVPISCFGNKISGYKLWFELTETQKKSLDIEEISNVYTGESRDVEMSDDAARTVFWDQQWIFEDNVDGIENPLKARYIEDIDNDGYVYIPYSCLNFCYGSENAPPQFEDGEECPEIKYDRAATEVALSREIDGVDRLLIAPPTVDPRQIIQFLCIPKGATIELDDDGVILNKDFSYFTTVEEWNRIVQGNYWYIFEDTRLVSAETLGSKDLMDSSISHTYRYILDESTLDEDKKILDSYRESWGNKTVYYEGYLSNINENYIIKGRKYSITDRTELNISEEIDQYVTVYNNQASEYEDAYTSEDWEFNATSDNVYRVCSKTATRQIIPQMARNLIQNGKDIDSIEGWSPMQYLKYDSTSEDIASSAALSLKTFYVSDEASSEIAGTLLYLDSPKKNLAYIWIYKEKDSDKEFIYLYSIGSDYYTCENPTSPIPLLVHHSTTEQMKANKDKTLEKKINDNTQKQDILTVYPVSDYINQQIVYTEEEQSILSYLIYMKELYLETVKMEYEMLQENSIKRYITFDKSEMIDGQVIYINAVVNQEKISSRFSDAWKDYIDENVNIYNEYVANLISVNQQIKEAEEKGTTFEQYYEDAIVWGIKLDPNKPPEYHSVPLTINDYRFVNFGIIGQEKTIEKDKIYCLGFSGYIQDTNFKFLIGRGSLISEGSYNLSEDFIQFNGKDIFEDIESTSSAGTDEESEDWIITSGIFDLDDEIWGEIIDAGSISLADMPPDSRYILFRAPKTIENPYFVVESRKPMIVYKLELFEAYTKGYDSFSDAEYYRYSGRELFGNEAPNTDSEIDKSEWKYFEESSGYSNALQYYYSYQFSTNQMRNRIIFEDTIMLGSTYGYQQYFIQRLVAEKIDDEDEEQYYDTMGQQAFISSDDDILIDGQLPLDAAKYTEDNYTIQTNYIDMSKCKYYVPNVKRDACDCAYSSRSVSSDPSKTCYYQKFGYCPYRFETEKHDRKIRTLSVSKSNRFNIIQEISKVFEFYPQFYIDHKSNGKVVLDDEDNYSKQVFFITEKGMENKVGFRYEKNLKDISRSIDSNQIVTKLYVQDVDSELSSTGLCSIKTAEDNPSKDSYIIDLSYYIEKGMLDEDEVNQDLYGLDPITETLDSSDVIPQGFLRQLGYYNTQYDNITNKIINLQDASYTELEANLTVNLEGIVTAQEQLLKCKKQLEQYKTIATATSGAASQTELNYQTKYEEQQAILVQLITDTFFTNGKYSPYRINGVASELYTAESGWDMEKINNSPNFLLGDASATEWFDCIADFEKLKEQWVENHKYNYGILGQYNQEYSQIQAWKKERASYLKLINRISSAFYKKYEPYLKEGTWTDSNYLTDNAYYFGALDVAADGSIPKVTYTISVIALGIFDDIYNIYLGDTSHIEDIGMFGINQKTGLPNQLKILVSELSYNLDDASKDTISVKNYTTSFQDLFQQVSASVQSLTYNENVYKRSSNFTSLQNVEKDSLQGTLDSNEMTYLDTDEQNIQLDNTGTRGSDINNHANKYKLDGQGLYFSNDGGQHWSVGVGPSGINADYIKVGTLDAGKIRIADSNYVYFSWDKDGIVAYRDPMSITATEDNMGDFAEFNKFGLSIIEQGKIKLRAGYSFNGQDGDITKEKDPGLEVGFYLFNSDGQVIFSTEAASNISSEEDLNKYNTARLLLRGEMFVTDDLNGTDIAAGMTTYTINNVTYEVSKIYPYELRDTIQMTYNQGEIEEISTLVDISVVKIIKDNNTDHHQDILESKKMYSVKTSDEKKYYIYNENQYNKLKELQESTDSSQTYSSTFTQVTANTVMYYSINGKSANLSTTASKCQQLSPVFRNIDLPDAAELYELGGKYYYGHEDGNQSFIQTTEASSSIQSSNAAAIFINNRSSLTTNEDSHEHMKRLFSIVVAGNKDDNNIYNNILSVLRNGDLYLGGKIKNADNTYPSSLEKMDDYVQITNEGLRYEVGSGLHISFEELYDTRNNQSLRDYIGTNINNALQSLDFQHFHFFCEETNDGGAGRFDSSRNTGFFKDGKGSELKDWQGKEDKVKKTDIYNMMVDLFDGVYFTRWNGTETSDMTRPVEYIPT